MNKDQLTFTAVRDWREPQVITPSGLEKMLTEARAAGFTAIRMDAIRFPFGYRVTFTRSQAMYLASGDGRKV